MYDCEISPMGRSTVSVSRPLGRSVYDLPAFQRHRDAVVDPRVSIALAPVLAPLPPRPRDVAVAPNAAAYPQVRPQRPRLRSLTGH